MPAKAELPKAPLCQKHKRAAVPTAASFETSLRELSQCHFVVLQCQIPQHACRPFGAAVCNYGPSRFAACSCLQCKELSMVVVYRCGVVGTCSLLAWMLCNMPSATSPHWLDAPCASSKVHQALNPALGNVLQHLPFYSRVEGQYARPQHLRQCMPLNAPGIELQSARYSRCLLGPCCVSVVPFVINMEVRDVQRCLHRVLSSSCAVVMPDTAKCLRQMHWYPWNWKALYRVGYSNLHT